MEMETYRIIVAILAFIWMLGYPIYKEIKKEDLWKSNYALVCSILGITIAFLNLLIKNSQ